MGSEVVTVDKAGVGVSWTVAGDVPTGWIWAWVGLVHPANPA